MRVLITTSRALKELATGTTPSTTQTSTALFLWDGTDCQYLLTQRDGIDDQRIAILRNEKSDDLVIPHYLSSDRRAALSRMASFAERARVAGPLNLPRAWRQYKHNNLVTFFAVPSVTPHATRWITEVFTGSRADIVFWRAADAKATLEEFDLADRKNPIVDEEWSRAIKAAEQHFAGSVSAARSDVEIALPELSQAATRGWSYKEWMELLSDDQTAFVNAPTDKSIRLRGPAGSGKTLALTLKAVRELLEAQSADQDIKILMVTHSWSLAAEISDSKDSLGLGPLTEIDVFPLLEVASAISHGGGGTGKYSVIGTDSFSGKLAQLEEIHDLIADFIAGDWITYRSQVSPALRTRFDSDDPEDRKALAWDLLIEFGSVIGAAAIFPGAGSESKYLKLGRASWMMPLPSPTDKRVIFDLYSLYMESLEDRGLLTSDQVLADLLSDLQKHSWNRARKTEGYDLIFVDEFHLFNPLERQILHYLSRDVSVYPRIFMALDPRQSPSEAFIGLASDATRSSVATGTDRDLGEIANFELTRVHRYSPQILSLVKHVHLEFPALDLGGEWDINFSAIESAREAGPVPKLLIAGSRAGEENDIAVAVQDRYHAGRMALAIVDTRQWGRFSKLASLLGQSSKFHVSTVTGRSDVEGLGYRKRGLVVGPAEYLAGLQFDTVLVAGIPDLGPGSRTASDTTRLLSLLYLGISRAESEVRVFVNEDDGGAPEVLQRAVANGFMTSQRGNLV